MSSSPTKCEHPERLLMLGDLLDRDAANPKGSSFNLGFWVAPYLVDDPHNIGTGIGAFTPGQLGFGEGDDLTGQNRVSLPKLPEMSCGTSACALGLAALSGEFAKFGLTMGYSVVDRVDFVATPKTLQDVLLVPSCNGADGFQAGVELFGITYGSSTYLFDPQCYGSMPVGAEGERRVAQRIRDFVAGKINKDLHPFYRD